MSREEAAMRPRGEAQESEAPEGAPREVEGLRREARREPLGLAGSALGAEPREVDREPGRSGRRELAGAGAQHGMPLDERAHGRRPGGAVERSRELDREREGGDAGGRRALA